MDSNKIDKIIGYILLAIGLLFIIIPLYQAYGVIAGSATPPSIFKQINFLQPNQNVGQMDFQKQIENALMEVLPLDMINEIINLLSWAILMSVFIFGGKQISLIGIKMIKKD